jgi:hypothetical protein
MSNLSDEETEIMNSCYVSSAVDPDLLIELEVDSVTYHMLYLNQCLCAERVDVLVEFLGFYRYKLDKIPYILTDTQLDTYYTRLFESESIHKFLIFMLSGCENITDYVETLQNTIIQIKSNNPNVIFGLRRFAFEYSFANDEDKTSLQSSTKFRIVIRQSTAYKLEQLFGADSPLHRFSLNGALTIAAEIHGKFMRSRNGLIPSGERLYVFQDGMDNVNI